MKNKSCYIFNLSFEVFCWSSRKEKVVAQSMPRTKYIAPSKTTNQAVWLQNVLGDLGHNQITTKLFYDKKHVIPIVQNPLQHQRTKYIKIKYHTIKDYEREILIKMQYFSSQN